MSVVMEDTVVADMTVCSICLHDWCPWTKTSSLE